MTTITKPRIQSIDLLKGLVMVIMALDHTRDYFHYSAFFFDPTDLTQTTWPIFFTRFITHFCAPAFSFLAGLSAFMIGKRKPLNELSGFLFKRGLWLVFVEIIIINFGWKFDVNFTHIGLQTIWSLGISMIVLVGLIYLPKKAILAFSLVIIFGHNLLDNIHFDGNFLWAMLHERQKFEFAEGHTVIFAYSLLPWIAVMSLGYCFGSLYDSTFNIKKRDDNPVTGKNPTITALIDYEQFCGMKAVEEKPMREITARELYDLQVKGEPFQLIDVREPNEYEIANLGGELIPLSSIGANVDHIARDKKVVVHCKMGGSAKAIRELEEKYGFTNLYNLKGGIIAYIDEVDPALTKY